MHPSQNRHASLLQPHAAPPGFNQPASTPDTPIAPIPSVHSQIDADLEKEKALKRAERFGIEHPELEAIKKEQRAARFGIVDEETRKKQRLDKFKPLPAGGGAKDKPDFNVAIKADDDFEAKRKVR